MIFVPGYWLFGTMDIPNMDDIHLEDEDEDGIDIMPVQNTAADTELGFNWKLCLIGRFLQIGSYDFSAMQQTLASLWKPGKSVFMKELDDNRFIFQFYHELDIKRVIDGSPWYFNRKALIITRMTEDGNPLNVPLNKMDIWVQVFDLQTGFMNNNVLRAVGNQLGQFVETCSKNFLGTWRNYMRVRVTLDITKPLKRRLKIKKTSEDFF